MPSSPRASAEDLSERIKVSFEFFPPKNGDMENQLWDSITQARTVPARLRVGDLWCRRIDQTADAEHRDTDLLRKPILRRRRI
jgi:hypothetical protein